MRRKEAELSGPGSTWRLAGGAMRHRRRWLPEASAEAKTSAGGAREEGLDIQGPAKGLVGTQGAQATETGEGRPFRALSLEET